MTKRIVLLGFFDGTEKAEDFVRFSFNEQENGLKISQDREANIPVDHHKEFLESVLSQYDCTRHYINRSDAFLQKISTGQPYDLAILTDQFIPSKPYDQLPQDVFRDGLYMAQFLKGVEPVGRDHITEQTMAQAIFDGDITLVQQLVSSYRKVPILLYGTLRRKRYESVITAKKEGWIVDHIDANDPLLVKQQDLGKVLESL